MRKLTTASATGSCRSMRNKRRSVGEAMSCDRRRPSMWPSSCEPSQPSRVGTASKLLSSRASRGMFAPCAAMRRSVAALTSQS